MQQYFTKNNINNYFPVNPHNLSAVKIKIQLINIIIVLWLTHSTVYSWNFLTSLNNLLLQKLNVD